MDKAVSGNAFDQRIFELRMERSRADLFGMLERLYGERPDYARFCKALTKLLADAWAARPDDLKWLDLKRDLEPDWFQRPRHGRLRLLHRPLRRRPEATSPTGSTISRTSASPMST